MDLALTTRDRHAGSRQDIACCQGGAVVGKELNRSAIDENSQLDLAVNCWS
jgi:hypothetical protein